MKKQEPLVSVGITTYNRPSGLKITLKCITSQTFKNLEIIVSDNCSPGYEISKIVKEFQKKDKRIKYFRQKSNFGLRFNSKFVLEKATGKYFMWAADDDSWEPSFISELVRRSEKNPEAGVAMSGFRIVFQKNLTQVVRYNGQNNPNKKTIFQIFWATLHSPRTKYYLFVCGLFNTQLIREALPKFADFYAPDRFLMVYFSLIVPFEYVDKILYRKSLDSAIRFKEEPEEIKKFSWWGEFVSIFKLALVIIYSSKIPISRKLYALPIEMFILIFRFTMHLIIASLGYVLIIFNFIVAKIKNFQAFLYQKYVWSK